MKNRRFVKLCLYFTALFFTLSVSAQTEMVVNGDFETGNLAGWTTTGYGVTATCPAAPRDWNVNSANSTGCQNVGNPVFGAYAVYNMLDGPAGTHYRMYQTINLPYNITDAQLHFFYNAIWYTGSYTREFRIRIYDQTNTTLLATLHQIAFTGSGNSGGWTNVNDNVTATLAPYSGQTVVFDVSVFIPGTWSGGAGLAVDEMSLLVTGTAAAGVPTLSQWGLILFTLLSLTMATLLIGRSRMAFAGGGAATGLFHLIRTAPFEARAYLKILGIMLPLAIAGFALVHSLIGTNGALDFSGTIASTCIVSYIIYLSSLMVSKEG